MDAKIEPTEAYVQTLDGEQIPCLIEQVGENQWQMTPVIDVDLEDVAEMYVDVLPGGAKVGFVLGTEEEE